MLGIIIPACNEEGFIGSCLDSLLQQNYADNIEIVVAANGCVDKTADLARSKVNAFKEKGYALIVLEIEKGGKNNAMNQADKACCFGHRLYLDADVTIDPSFIAQAIELLSVDTPRYVSGTLETDCGKSAISKAYGLTWSQAPYIRKSIPGYGCYAVNETGRKRWGQFPKIQSDDKFVRLLFTVSERHKTMARYYWPVPQGFLNLLKARTRWIKGNRHLLKTQPDLLISDSKRLKLDMPFVKYLILHPIKAILFFVIYSLATMIAYSMPISFKAHWERPR